MSGRDLSLKSADRGLHLTGGSSDTRSNLETLRHQKIELHKLCKFRCVTQTFRNIMDQTYQVQITDSPCTMARHYCKFSFVRSSDCSFSSADVPSLPSSCGELCRPQIPGRGSVLGLCHRCLQGKLPASVHEILHISVKPARGSLSFPISVSFSISSWTDLIRNRFVREALVLRSSDSRCMMGLSQVVCRPRPESHAMALVALLEGNKDVELLSTVDGVGEFLVQSVCSGSSP